MLLVIGTVLSVLSIFFPELSWPLPVGIGVWMVSLILSVFADWGETRRREREAREAEQREKERDRMLSEVVHELKTPLTVIRGSVEVLADGAVPAEQYPEYYARILRETNAMTKLVSDLLDTTRPEEKFRLELQSVDLALLCNEVCEDLQTVAAAAGVTLTCDIRTSLLPMVLDPDRIGQLAVILLDNAIKHTPEGGLVTLFLDRKGKSVLLGVRDNGSGIAAEDLPFLFDRYYKAPVERGGLASGSGIGLSLAKKIAELHGGTIDVESKPGKGSCFTVRIPLSDPR